MLFKQRKPRKFKYPAHRLKDESKSKPEDIKSKWEEVRGENSVSGNSNRTLAILIVALGMIIVLWYVLNNYEI